MAKGVGFGLLEEEVIDFLLQMIGKELSTEDLDEPEKQRHQLEEEEVEAQQQPKRSVTTQTV